MVLFIACISIYVNVRTVEVKLKAYAKLRFKMLTYKN